MVRKRKLPRGVYEKVPGSGIYWIRYADATGKIRREKSGPSIRRALDLLSKRKAEVLQGKKLPELNRRKPVLFSELAQDALEYSKSHKRSHRIDRCRMANILEAFAGRVASSITPQDIERWLADEADDRDWEPATINRYKALFSLTFRLGVENSKVERNPASFVRRRLENNARIRYLLPEEEVRLRRAIEAHFPARLPEFEIALNTGMRCSEQYGLTWQYVNLPAKVITIPLAKHGQTRHVALNSAARNALYVIHQRSSGTGRVFLNEAGFALERPRYWFEKAVKLAAIEDFTWHCLRHTFASRLVMAGVNLRTVQQLMGHKSIQMTCRYAHLSPDVELAAVERLCKTEYAQQGSTDTRTSTGVSDDFSAEAASVQ